MLITNDTDTTGDLQQELLHNEKLLWTGQPKTGVIFRTIDIFLIPFSLFWFGGVCTMLFVIPFPGTVIAIPFVLIGLYVTVGRFIFDIKTRSQTFYGITQNRVIIKSGIFKNTVDSINIRTIQKLSIKEKSDGSGTIKLADEVFPFSGFAAAGWPGRKMVPQLEAIPNVRKVYNIILQQQYTQ
jgi:hypothetical protein